MGADDPLDESEELEEVRLINCGPAEMAPFVEFALQGGWNVGLSDSDFLHRVDPSAYFMAVRGSEVVGTVAAVRYGNDFGFVGYHMVRYDMRRKGMGKSLLQEAMKRLGSRPMGLNCLVTQADYYERFGFSPAFSILALEGEVASPPTDPKDMVSPFTLPLEKLQAFDGTVFPYDRKQFISCWHAQPRSLLVGKFVDNVYKGYGMLRPCHDGIRIAPLLCDDVQTAEELLDSLLGNLPKGSTFYMDVPDKNSGAIELARKKNMRKRGELVRMYSHPQPVLSVEKIFSLPAMEIG